MKLANLAYCFSLDDVAVVHVKRRDAELTLCEKRALPAPLERPRSRVTCAECDRIRKGEA